MAGAGAGAGQGFPGAEDPEAAARIKELKSLLELERGLRAGAEKQLAAFKKRLAYLERMQQDQSVEGVPSAHPCELPPPRPSPSSPGGTLPERLTSLAVAQWMVGRLETTPIGTRKLRTI